MATALIDELMEEYNDKYLVIGFDMNRNLIEVIIIWWVKILPISFTQ
jgi:hypothetical protein